MIYIATHKKVDLECKDHYIVLQVGAEGKEDLGYVPDNTGDNISEKNPHYCELTGLYWIWKNTRDDYKGLVHYRRYFGKSNLSGKRKHIYSYAELEEMLQEADVVLPYVEYFLQNAKDELLISCCTEEIFIKLERIIKKKYPDYMDAFEEYFSQNSSTLFNMMFCRAEIFDAYCKWLFDILFELEKVVDLSELNEYQQRLYGFLSERLLNIWIRKNKLKVKNVKVIHLEMSFGERLNLCRRRCTNRIRYRLKNKTGRK